MAVEMMPGDVTRLERMAERLAVVESKMQAFEKSIPRIGKLEASMAGVNAKLESLAEDMYELKNNSQHTLETLETVRDRGAELDNRLGKLGGQLAGAAMVAGLIISAINVLSNLANLDSWQGQHEEQTEVIERLGDE